MAPYDWSVIAQRFSLDKKKVEKNEESLGKGKEQSLGKGKEQPKNNWNWLTLALWKKQQKEKEVI